MHDTDKDRIMSKIRYDDTHWIWNGGCHPQGYPMIRLKSNGSMVLVARHLKQDEFIKPFTTDDRVKRLCDNPQCVNPEHHEVYTKADWQWSNGYKNGKYNFDDIKQLYDDYHGSPRYWGKVEDYSKKFNIPKGTLQKMLYTGIYLGKSLK